MPFESISLDHKILLSPRLKGAGTSLSEYSFANLYLFRRFHDYQILTEGPDIFITGKTYDGFRFLMPASGPASAAGVTRLLDAVRIRGLDFAFPIPQEWLGALEAAGTPAPQFSDDDSDYVYNTEKLCTYAGPKMHGKKNLLNQFMALYTPRALPLVEKRMADARDILEAWQVDVGEPKDDTDYHPCLEAFEFYEELVLCGGIYYVNEEPAGFIIGEELNNEMFALHFAKGKRKFKGMYQYMFNHFANILPKRYAYLNFEQDMGKLALRIAKTSYHPDKVLKKYRVRPAQATKEAV